MIVCLEWPDLTEWEEMLQNASRSKVAQKNFSMRHFAGWRFTQAHSWVKQHGESLRLFDGFGALPQPAQELA